MELSQESDFCFPICTRGYIYHCTECIAVAKPLSVQATCTHVYVITQHGHGTWLVMGQQMEEENCYFDRAAKFPTGSMLRQKSKTRPSKMHQT
jgi:hypothetical protein